MYDTPILLIVFNRPDETKQVFDILKTLKPKNLFVAADGPRPNNLKDEKGCAAVRDIVTNIDWDCNLRTLFREKNLGCGMAVSGCISWFFEQVEYGIVLEDDCLPDTSFFHYCSHLLEHYAKDEKVMFINGFNCQDDNMNLDASYYFSKYPSPWGWATWRRAWANFDYNLKDLKPFMETDKMNTVTNAIDEKLYWYFNFKTVQEGRIDTWDFQWIYTVWNKGGIGIAPKTNLVSNIGFGVNATHTTKVVENLTQIKTSAITEIKHPTAQEVNREADHIFYLRAHNKKSVIKEELLDMITSPRKFIPKAINYFKRVYFMRNMRNKIMNNAAKI